MTWRSFLYAADALMAEEGLSFHVETAEKPAPTPEENKSRNAESMNALKGIMAGLGSRKRR